MAHIETAHLKVWQAKAKSLGLQVTREDGKGEDPYTYYYAHNGSLIYGLFSDANGSDNSYGVFFDKPKQDKWSICS